MGSPPAVPSRSSQRPDDVDHRPYQRRIPRRPRALPPRRPPRSRGPGRRRPVAAAPRPGGDVHHRPEHQLHQRLRRRLRILRLRPSPQAQRRVRAELRADRAEGRRVQGGRRGPDPDAGGAQPLHPLRVVPRPAALHQDPPPDPHPRLLPVGGGLLLGALQAPGRRRDQGAARRGARLDPRRRGRDPGRLGPGPGGPEEGADRRVARGAGGGAPPGDAHFGDDDGVESSFRIRDLQRRTGGFTAFICWPLQPDGTPMFNGAAKTDAVTYLRTLALMRIVADNVPNMQASWVTMGHKVGQVALRFGANDYGSLMMEENVVSATGTTYGTTLREMDRLILDAGYTPRRRRQDYSLLADHQ